MWSSADTFWGKGFLATRSRNSKPRPQKDLKRTRQGPGYQLRISEQRKGEREREGERMKCECQPSFIKKICLKNNNEHTHTHIYLSISG